MDGASHEHQFVPHQHDATGDLMAMSFELFRRATAEIDHFGRKAFGRGRRRAHQRVARCWYSA
jgi:hypothetical protein